MVPSSIVEVLANQFILSAVTPLVLEGQVKVVKHED